jgi:hypothetical protein
VNYGIPRFLWSGRVTSSTSHVTASGTAPFEVPLPNRQMCVALSAASPTPCPADCEVAGGRVIKLSFVRVTDDALGIGILTPTGSYPKSVISARRVVVAGRSSDRSPQ